MFIVKGEKGVTLITIDIVKKQLVNKTCILLNEECNNVFSECMHVADTFEIWATENVEITENLYKRGLKKIIIPLLPRK